MPRHLVAIMFPVYRSIISHIHHNSFLNIWFRYGDGIFHNNRFLLILVSKESIVLVKQLTKSNYLSIAISTCLLFSLFLNIHFNSMATATEFKPSLPCLTVRHTLTCLSWSKYKACTQLNDGYMYLTLVFKSLLTPISIFTHLHVYSKNSDYFCGLWYRKYVEKLSRYLDWVQRVAIWYTLPRVIWFAEN